VSTIIIGVDPGLTGGIALLFPAARAMFSETDEIRLFAIPVVGKEIDFKTLRLALDVERPVHVFLERAQAWPKMASRACFNYGASYWGVQAICACLKIPCTLVPPAKWHRALIVGRDGNPKMRALQTVMRLFPDVDLIIGKGKKPHQGVVDALLIAHYGQRVLAGSH